MIVPGVTDRSVLAHFPPTEVDQAGAPRRRTFPATDRTRTLSPMTTTERAVDVGASEDVPERGRLVVEIGGPAGPVALGVFRFGGRLHAWENRCAHQGGPACQGRIVSRVRERLDDEQRSLGLRSTRTPFTSSAPGTGSSTT